MRDDKREKLNMRDARDRAAGMFHRVVKPGKGEPDPEAGSAHPSVSGQDSRDINQGLEGAPGESGVGKVRGLLSRRVRSSKPHEPSAITRLVMQWCNRLLGAAQDRSFHEHKEQYAADCTSQDFLWNSLGMIAWGVVFPLLTIIVTQLSGADGAGRFSMAFVIASLLMILANFGIRTFQISDVREEYSFADYRINRLITCIVAVLAGMAYCNLRGYDEAMSTMCFGLVLYKTVDGFADVYEGRLQQMGKLYLAGVSQTLRSAVVFVVFTLGLLVSGSLPFASMAMGIAAVLTLVFISLPLAHLETPKSRPPRFEAIVGLFKQSWPLFAALFMYSLVDNMPKFVMEGALPYDNQLYYNALYFPAMFVLMAAQTIYKPMLVRMANVWHDPEKRRRFDLIILAVVVCIVVITAVMGLIMMGFGLSLLGFLYGLDFEQFREISLIMLIAGGLTAGIDFIYQTITILRRQKDVMMAYVIALILALFTPMLLIQYAKLEGAILSYLIVMAVLFILMLWIYFRVRFSRDRGPAPDFDDPHDGPRDGAHDNLHGGPHDGPYDGPRNVSPDGPRSAPHDSPYDGAYDNLHGGPHGGPYDGPRDGLRDIPSDGPRERPGF